MLILEIILTIVAWGRGWKWLALLPLGMAFGIGLIAGANGVTDLDSLIWIDVVAIVALIAMIIAKKKPVKEETDI